MNKVIWATLVATTALFGACSDQKGPKANLKTDIDTLSYELGMANSVTEDNLKQYLAMPQVGSDTAYVEEFLKGLKDGMRAADNKKRAAYVAGLQAGMQFKMNLKQTEEYVFGDDSTKHFSVKNYLAGFSDGMGGKKTALKLDGKPADKQAVTMDVQERMKKMADVANEKKYAKEMKASKDFIARKAKEEGVRKLPGGTLYKVIKAGTGEKPKDGQQVKVIYEGKLANGTVFDSSSNQPVEFTVGRAIPGFNAALMAMPVGSTWEVYIPYDQAYGSQAGGPIPAYAALTFTITVVSIESPARQKNGNQ